jgi:hypothetical protein
LKQHSIQTLVDNHIHALLSTNSDDAIRFAGIETMRLLGTDRDRWEKWLYGFSRDARCLAALVPNLPVRDPKLAQSLYEMALEKLLIFAEMTEDYETAYIRQLRSWGPTAALSSYARMLPEKDFDDVNYQKTMRDLHRRYTQSSVNYLADSIVYEGMSELDAAVAVGMGSTNDDTSSGSFRRSMELEETHALNENGGGSLYKKDALFSILSVRNRVEARVHSSSSRYKRVDLFALAELHRMSNDHKNCLKLYLRIGEEFCPRMDDACLRTVMEEPVKFDAKSGGASSFNFVLAYIDAHNEDSLFELATETESSIVSLIQLVGVRLAGDFLVERCMGMTGERSIQRIYEALRERRVILLWFLHLVFLNKTDMYVRPTSTNSNFAFSVHERHLQLLVEFCSTLKRDGRAKWSAGGPFESPLMSFLRTMLKQPAVGVRADDARALLSKDKSLPRELGFVMEKSEVGEDDAKTVVNLYLVECESVMLATNFAEAHSASREVLWEIVVAHCLKNEKLGELLECAASIGADLSTLVAKIPKGMEIKELKAKLLNSIDNYRVLVECHRAVADVASADRLCLLRNKSHIVRRGVREKREKRRDVAGAVFAQAREGGGGVAADEDLEKRRKLAQLRMRNRDRNGKIKDPGYER